MKYIHTYKVINYMLPAIKNLGHHKRLNITLSDCLSALAFEKILL